MMKQMLILSVLILAGCNQYDSNIKKDDDLKQYVVSVMKRPQSNPIIPIPIYMYYVPVKFENSPKGNNLFNSSRIKH